MHLKLIEIKNNTKYCHHITVSPPASQCLVLPFRHSTFDIQCSQKGNFAFKELNILSNKDAYKRRGIN